MKKSLYNTYLSLEDGSYLLYNSFSDKFVAVPASLLQGHNPAEMTPAEVREFSPELYARLEEAGMLVPDELDETAALQERIDAIDNNPAVFHLQLNPTVDCENSDKNCAESHNSGACQNSGGFCKDTQNGKGCVNISNQSVQHPCSC